MNSNTDSFNDAIIPFEGGVLLALSDHAAVIKKDKGVIITDKGLQKRRAERI